MNRDTLDYLIPSITKKCESSKSDFWKEPTEDEIRGYKKLSRKQAKAITKVFEHLKPEVETSTSSVFEAITDKILLEPFTNSNLINSQGGKNYFATKVKSQKLSVPTKNVIKITVVPVTSETAHCRIAHRRSQKLKNTRKTVSNTNASIYNNIFSFQNNLRRINEVREVSSTDFIKPKRWERKYETYLNEIKSIKTILNSLNMNYNGRLGKETKLSPRNSRKSCETAELGCICDNTKVNKVLDDMNFRKNRVRIVGRFGINENDQYVLNCAATVDDEPIKNNYDQQYSQSVPINRTENNSKINKMTRATQANINITLTADNLDQLPIGNNTVLCNCKNAKDAGTSTSACTIDESGGRKSPLIVISVYPLKETVQDIHDLGDMIEINQPQKSLQSYKNPSTGSTITHDKRKIYNTFVNKSMAKSNVSKSPAASLKAISKSNFESPTSRRSISPSTKNINYSKIDTISLRSRSRSPTQKNVSKEKTKKKLLSRSSQKSIRASARKDRQAAIHKTLIEKHRAVRKPVIVNDVQTSKVYPFKSIFGGTKENSGKNNKIKKAIIENYTQRILMHEKEKDQLKNTTDDNNTRVLRKNASAVTVDIDGDNEKYRVLFLQDKLSTDLCIRKTLKLNKTTNKANESNNEKGNIVKKTKKNICTTSKETKLGKKLEKQSRNFETVDNKAPGFNIRDSLEIRQRREEGRQKLKNHSYNDYEPTIKVTNKSIKKRENNEDVSASAKHFRGDQCCVPNPFVRDQEIRDLLGINKPRTSKFEFIQAVLPETIGQKLNDSPEKCMENNCDKSHHSSLSHRCCSTSIENINKQTIVYKLTSTWTQCDENITTTCKQMVLNPKNQVEHYTKQKRITLSRKQYEKVKKTIKKKVSKKISRARRSLNKLSKCSVVSIRENRETNISHLTSDYIRQTSTVKQLVERNDIKRDHEGSKLLILNAGKKTKYINLFKSPRQVASSMEVRYSSMTHLKHVTFSSTNIKNKEAGSLFCDRMKNFSSIQTIFKGYKKCITPNLGVSGCSLYSDEEIVKSNNKYLMNPNDEKPKKPFFKRLMSCLVMRSGGASEAILSRQHQPLSLKNSFDSYHISTSLAAIDLTSSLYDTSVSFYSNHTVLPINRVKRGFFSSVRGLFTNLKSR